MVNFTENESFCLVDAEKMGFCKKLSHKKRQKTSEIVCKMYGKQNM